MQRKSSPGSKEKTRKYYPLCLDLKGRKVAVIGGGSVAERKILSLIEKGADITVISPTLTERLRAIAKRGRIKHLPKAYKKGVLRGSFLVIGASGQKEVNRAVAEEAKTSCGLYNIVDDPEKSNFIVPSIFQRGKLLISISTSGISPALSKNIRIELEKKYGKEYALFLNLMESIRKRLLKEIPSEARRKKIFQALVRSDLIDTIKKKGLKDAAIKAEELVKSLVGGL